jgi:hypothetical protein
MIIDGGCHILVPRAVREKGDVTIARTHCPGGKKVHSPAHHIVTLFQRLQPGCVLRVCLEPEHADPAVFLFAKLRRPKNCIKMANDFCFWVEFGLEELPNLDADVAANIKVNVSATLCKASKVVWISRSRQSYCLRRRLRESVAPKNIKEHSKCNGDPHEQRQVAH